MADDCRLRQTGGSGGVDVERAIVDGDLRQLRGIETVARKLLDRHGDVGQSGTAVAMRPHDGIARQMRRRTAKGVEQIARDDDVPRRDGVDAMGERGSHEMSVEQRDDAAGATDPAPDRHVFGPVGHQQADRVALADSVHPGPAGVAIGAIQQRAKAQRPGIGHQRRRVAEPPRQFLDDDREGARGIVGDRRSQLQRAQPCLRRRTGSGPLRRGGIGVR
jgi:hypothetical protein